MITPKDPQEVEKMLASVDSFHGKALRMTVRTILRNVPKTGGVVTRKALQRLIKTAFRAGAISERLAHKHSQS